MSSLDHSLRDAARRGDSNECLRLLDQGARVDAMEERTLGSGGVSALHLAAQNGHLDVVQGLLDRKADFQLASNIRWTPLHYAAHNGHVTIVELLLNTGADIESGAKGTGTPLDNAASGGRANVVELLLARGASVQATDKDGNTALHSAAAAGFRTTSLILLDHGADANAHAGGTSPLHWAAMNGKMSTVALLLDRGADIHATRSHDGDTPLHMAASRGRTEMVEFLLSKGARLDVKNRIGFTPFDSAAVSHPQMDSRDMASDKARTAELIRDYILGATTDVRNRTLGEAVFLSKWLPWIPLLGPHAVRTFQHYFYAQCWARYCRIDFPALVPYLNLLAYTDGSTGRLRTIKRLQMFGRRLRTIDLEYRLHGLSRDACEDAIYEALALALTDNRLAVQAFRFNTLLDRASRAAPAPRGEHVFRLAEECKLHGRELRLILSDYVRFHGYPPVSEDFLAGVESWLPKWDLSMLLELGEIERSLKNRWGPSHATVDAQTRQAVLDRYPWFSKDALDAAVKTLPPSSNG